MWRSMGVRTRQTQNSEAKAKRATAAAMPMSASAESARHVIFGQLLAGGGEQRRRRTRLNEAAQPEERRDVRHASGLLHVVGHDDDRVVALKFVDQLFD